MQISFLLLLVFHAVVVTTRPISNDTITSTHPTITLRKRDGFELTGTLPGLFYIGSGNMFKVDKWPITLPSVYYSYSTGAGGLIKKDQLPIKAIYKKDGTNYQSLPSGSSGFIYIPPEFANDMVHPYKMFPPGKAGSSSHDGGNDRSEYGTILNQVTISTKAAPAIQVHTQGIDLGLVNYITLMDPLQLIHLSHVFNAGYRPVLRNIGGKFFLDIISTTRSLF